MALPASVLGRLTGGGSSPTPRGVPNLRLFKGPPAYQTLDQISKESAQPPKDSLVIPKRYQRGGVASDDDDDDRRSSWQPARDGGTTGLEATSPDNNYQEGGTVAFGGGYPDYPELRARMTPAQAQLAYQRAMAAMRPIYTGQMLTRPPSQLSGYYGELGGMTDREAAMRAASQRGGGWISPEETARIMGWPSVPGQTPPTADEAAMANRIRQQMAASDNIPSMPANASTTVFEPPPERTWRDAVSEGVTQAIQQLGYQEGGIVDPNTGKVIRNYATEGAGRYYYVDPKAGRLTYGQAALAYQPAAVYPASVYNPMVASGLVHTGENILDWTEPNVGGRTFVRSPEDEAVAQSMAARINAEMNRAAGMIPEGENPYSFQGGGVLGVDPATGLPSPTGTQAPQQQASPVAGEPSKKKQPQRPAQPQQPQKYEFGPADFYYTAPGMKKLMEEQTAPIEKGMKQGGVLKEFMQHLAKGGLVKKPEDHLLVGLAMGYGLSAQDAAKGLKKKAGFQDGGVADNNLPPQDYYEDIYRRARRGTRNIKGPQFDPAPVPIFQGPSGDLYDPDYGKEDYRQLVQDGGVIRGYQDGSGDVNKEFGPGGGDPFRTSVWYYPGAQGERTMHGPRDVVVGRGSPWPVGSIIPTADGLRIVRGGGSWKHPGEPNPPGTKEIWLNTVKNQPHAAGFNVPESAFLGSQDYLNAFGGGGQNWQNIFTGGDLNPPSGGGDRVGAGSVSVGAETGQLPGDINVGGVIYRPTSDPSSQGSFINQSTGDVMSGDEMRNIISSEFPGTQASLNLSDYFGKGGGGPNTGGPTQRGVGTAVGIISNLAFPGLGLITSPLARMLTSLIQGGMSRDQAVATVKAQAASKPSDTGGGGTTGGGGEQTSRFPSDLGFLGAGGPGMFGGLPYGYSEGARFGGGAPIFTSAFAEGPNWTQGGSIFGGTQNYNPDPYGVWGGAGGSAIHGTVQAPGGWGGTMGGGSEGNLGAGYNWLNQQSQKALMAGGNPSLGFEGFTNWQAGPGLANVLPMSQWGGATSGMGGTDYQAGRTLGTPPSGVGGGGQSRV